MKNIRTTGIFVLTALFIGILAFPGTSLAAQPTLVLTSQSNNSVLVSSYGDPNSAVTLYYANSGNGSYTSVGSIGWTNQAGTFSTTLSNNSYSIANGAAVYVVVNGQQSPITYWPSVNNNNCYYNGYYNCNNYGNITLSQTNITLNQGQTNTVTIYNNNYNGYSNSYYVSNSNYPNIADVTVSGNQLTVRANNPGTATFNICSYNTTGCATLYVTVQQNYYNQYPYNYNNPYTYLYPYQQNLIFQPSTITVMPGQTVSYNMNGMSASYPQYGYGYNGYYGNTYGTQVYTYTTSGYNGYSATPRTANVTVYNSILTVTGVTPGTMTATICRNDNACGTLTVYVSNYSYYYPVR